MKDVAVVILNWNGKSFLEQFLANVIACSSGARIILADNASTDNSIAYIQANFPDVEIIQNASNGGFAKGYNDALQQVDAKFYLLLNSDIEVTPNWIEPLLKCMDDTSISGCQPKIRAFHQKDSFEHAGASGGFIDANYFPFCRGRIFNEVEKDTDQYNENMEVFWATGAALLIRSEVYHAHLGFDEDFFAHMEEIDLCWRIKRQGGRFLVVPESVVYHVGGGTLSYTSPRKVYLNFRNNLMMLIKNHEGLLFPKLMWRMILDGIAAIRFLFGGEFKNFGAVMRAHGYQYANLGTLLKKRRELKKSATQFNPKGWYKGSIIWAFYGKKVRKFSDLNQRLFK
ncbi:MAG: glycosyltransferase family 2 protein [bacterium]|nr:glycosyltransferase family 2 protein [bacterium]